MQNESHSPVNRLILGDNLEVMKTLPRESVDLIYLDPPFFSNRNYEVIWGDEGEIRSFKDRWSGGIDHYVTWLKERVELMYRLLKKTAVSFCTATGTQMLTSESIFSIRFSGKRISEMKLYGGIRAAGQVKNSIQETTI